MVAVQILSLLFALRMGLHDAVAVNGFTRCGSNAKEQDQFHSSNWQLKAVVCVGLSLPFYPNYWIMAEALAATGSIVWMVFDPVVARRRMNKQLWYYLTTGNQVDRILLHLFGPKAWIYKTIICAAIVAAIDVFYFR